MDDVRYRLDNEDFDTRDLLVLIEGYRVFAN